jgi:hypothetical protein
LNQWNQYKNKKLELEKNKKVLKEKNNYEKFCSLSQKGIDKNKKKQWMNFPEIVNPIYYL